MTDLNNAKVQTVVDKVKCLITGHNSDSSSHEDIRVNLAGKANVADIPTKTSDLTNDSGFLTSHQDVSGKVNVSDIKDNLTSTDTNKPLSAKQGKELKTLVDGKASSSHTHTKSEITDFPSIPSKTSDLTNDSGFLTSHQDISGKANIADIPTKTSDLTNDSGFLTQHQDITGKANSADLADVATSGDYNDLDNLPVIPEDVSDLTDLQNTPFTPKSHSHVLADLTNFTTVEVVVTYTDGTTETRQLVQYGQTVQGGE